MTDINSFWHEKWPLVLKGIGNDFVNELVRVAPVDTGFLRNNISYDVSGGTLNISMPEYGYYLEFGTKPHVITPKNKKSLHWKSGGADVFAMRVNHPGTEAQPFIRTTINGKLRDIVHKNISRYMR